MALNYEPSGRHLGHSGGAPLRASWPHHMDARLDFPAVFHSAYGRKHRLLHACESGDVRCSQPRASGHQAMGQDCDLLAIRGDTRHPSDCRVGRWPISLVIDVVVGRGLGICYAACRLDRCCMGGDGQPLIRHPGYFAAVLLFLGVALSLGSWWALIPGGFGSLLLVLRTVWEDRTLHAELPGYAEYAQRVRFRL